MRLDFTSQQPTPALALIPPNKLESRSGSRFFGGNTRLFSSSSVQETSSRAAESVQILQHL
jgi:hypothetical protein